MSDRDDASAAVVDAIVKAGGERTFVTVMTLDDAHPPGLVKPATMTAEVT